MISIHALLAESDQPRKGSSFLPIISIHALLAESDMQIVVVIVYALISIHALLAESDPYVIGRAVNLHPISIHALLAESDQYWATRARAAQLFLSTLSLRRATGPVLEKYIVPGISIHALLAESDTGRKTPPLHGPNFYPRSPCGERPETRTLPLTFCVFLSTLSLRRATPHHPPGVAFPTLFLSTLSLRRATISRYTARP